MASSVIMPRRSTSGEAPRERSLCSARATTFLADCWVSPSTTRTSSCLAVIFRIPAWSWREPSLLTDRTVAWVPIFTSSTVSPARAGRVGGGAGSSGRAPSFPSASLRLRRRAARSSLTRCQSSSFRWRRRMSLSSLNTWSAVSLASSRMARASAWAFSTALARSASILTLYSREALAVSSISRRSRAAASFSRSISWRCSSSWVSTSSKRTFSASMRAAAFWMMDLGRPNRSEMAKALDLPGMPMSRR